MPEGAGKDTFLSVCSLCHDPVTVVGKHFTKAQWQLKVTEMLQEEPDVTDAERATIVDYLTANFKPGGKIYANLASAKDLAEALELSVDEGMAIVQHRERNGLFKTLEDLKSVVGISIAKIDARKDRLAF